MTLQFVIIVPGIFLAIFSCIQVALFSFARSVALTAAEEGANAQRAYGAPPGAGQSRAMAVIQQQGDMLQNPQVQVVTQGGEIVVTVTWTTQSLIPGFSGFQVTETASGPIEEFQP